MEEAFEEGQGPHRAVEPVMMMMSEREPQLFEAVVPADRLKSAILRASFLYRVSSRSMKWLRAPRNVEYSVTPCC
jgi:hypothetical protein